MNAMGLFRIGYDNWLLVAFYVLLLGVFLFGILRPRRRKEWRSAGMAQGWVIALYAEMYGLPLTMYLVAWLTGRTEFVTDHFRGHTWAYLLGWGDAGAIVCDVIGQWLIAAGAVLGIVGWRQIYRGQGRIVCTGLYRRIRHPQYAGFFLFLLGSSINCPTTLRSARPGLTGAVSSRRPARSAGTRPICSVSWYTRPTRSMGERSLFRAASRHL